MKGGYISLIENLYGFEVDGEDIGIENVKKEEIISSNGTDEDVNKTFNSFITGKVSLDEESNGRHDFSLEDEVKDFLENGADASVIPVLVDYVPYDFDEDGLVDYIEWVVPHLSAQAYEIIVEDVSNTSLFILEDVVSVKEVIFALPA